MSDAFPDPSPWTLAFAVFVVSVCITPLTGLEGIFVRSFGHALLPWALVAAAVDAGGVLLNFARPKTPWAPRARPLGRAVATGQGMVLLAGAALVLSTWANLVQSFLLPATPRILVLAAVLAVALYAVIQGTETAIRVAALVGATALPLLVLLAFSVGVEAWPARLRPMALLPQDAWPLPILLFAPRGYVIVRAFSGPRAAHAPLPSAALAGVAGSILVSFLVLPELVLGQPFAASLTFPFRQVTGTVTSIFLPLSRVDVLMGVLWQMIAVAVVSSYLAAALASFGSPPRRAPPPWGVLAAGGAVFLLAAPYRTVPDIGLLFLVWSSAGLTVFLLAPAVQLLVSSRGGSP